MTPRGHAALFLTTILFHLFRISASQACNRTYTSPHGVITTPNFPLAYPGGITCSWHINFNNVTDVAGITLLIAKFLTQETNLANLYEEELLIYDRNPTLNNSWPQVYQGKLSNTSVYQTQRNEVWLRFTSATEVVNTTGIPGIKILYSAKIQREICNNLVVPPNTILIGDNFTVGSFAEFYCNSGFRMEGDSVLMCVLERGVPGWTATPPKCLATCTVPTLKNGEASYVNLRINTTTTFSCTPPYVISGSQRVTCISDSNGLPTWNAAFPRCVIPNCSETMDLRESEGVIVNPGYSTNTVQANKDCHWTITVQPGSVVRLYMRYFDLPSDEGSFLEVADAADERTVRLRLVGGQRARNVTSWSHKVDIQYRGPRTASTSNAGFYIQYDMDSGPILGQGHGTTPYVRPATTQRPTTPVNVITTYVASDTADTIKISVGVAVPTVILLGVLVGCYCWYRKKYPVRMIIGREFAKFSNPDYAPKGNSTLTLVREDADEFFKQASRATSTVSLVVDSTGPHYVNVGFKADENGHVSGELAPEEHQPIDEDEEEREMMKRKSYLFSHRDDYEANRKARESPSDSESASDVESVGGSSHGSRNANDVVVTVEHAEEEHLESSAPQQDYSSSNKSFISESTIDDFNAHFPNRAIRKTSVGVLLERTKERRAFTNEERPMRRFSFDASMSVRGRSLSAKTPEEVSRDAVKLNDLLRRCDISNNQLPTKQEVITEEDSTQEEIPLNKRAENDNVSQSSNDDHGTKTNRDHDKYGNDASQISGDVHRNKENHTESDNFQDQPQCQAEQADQRPQESNDSKEVEKMDMAPYENVYVTKTDGMKDNAEMNDVPSDCHKHSEKEEDGSSSDEDGSLSDKDVERKDQMKALTSSQASGDDYNGEDERRKYEHIEVVNDEENVDEIKRKISENENSDDEKFNSDDSDQVERVGDGVNDGFVVPVQNGSDLEDHEKIECDQKTNFSEGDQNTGVCQNDTNLEVSNGDQTEDFSNDNQSFRTRQDDQNTEESQRPKSESLSESFTSDSAVSSNSHVSGSYNFGNESDDEGDDEDDDDDDDKTIGDDDTNYKSNVDEDKHIPSDQNNQIEEKISKDHQVPVSTPRKPEVNLDSSSLSSFDQSLLDTSGEVSSVSTESPILTHKSLPPLPNPSGPKKVAAPVFSIGDDEDISSTDSDEDETPKKSESILPVVKMPGIEEEDSEESGKGQGASYSFGRTESDDGSEDGREFTDDDLMAELSDDSDKDKNRTHAQKQILSPGMLYFDEVNDDDLDV